ncbi:hypothetical protein D9M68_857470 [compost metagenome]
MNFERAQPVQKPGDSRPAGMSIQNVGAMDVEVDCDAASRQNASAPVSHEEFVREYMIVDQFVDVLDFHVCYNGGLGRLQEMRLG